MSQTEQEKQPQKTSITKGWDSQAERTLQAHSGSTPLILQMRKPGPWGESGLPRNWAVSKLSGLIASLTVTRGGGEGRLQGRKDR